MARGGKQKFRPDPERKCIVTGDVHPRRGLIRFAIGPEGQIVPDVAGKLPGRGLWLSAEREVLETAMKKKPFARAAKQAVTVPDDLVEAAEKALLRRVQDRLSLARKAGKAVAGFEKVKEMLARGDAAILIQACDGSERGRSKLYRPSGPGSHFQIMTADEIGLSFGRERVIHAALAAGVLADAFREDAVRLSGVRKSNDGETPPER